jgi:hypothetical protein
MSTSKTNVVDDDTIPEFDFSRAIPSPFRDRARNGMRFHIVTDGADRPIYHVTARRRRRGWWIEIDEIEGSGGRARVPSIESVARGLISRACGLDPSQFDLVIDLPQAA